MKNIIGVILIHDGFDYEIQKRFPAYDVFISESCPDSIESKIKIECHNTADVFRTECVFVRHFLAYRPGYRYLFSCNGTLPIIKWLQRLGFKLIGDPYEDL